MDALCYEYVLDFHISIIRYYITFMMYNDIVSESYRCCVMMFLLLLGAGPVTRRRRDVADNMDDVIFFVKKAVEVDCPETHSASDSAES